MYLNITHICLGWKPFCKVINMLEYFCYITVYFTNIFQQYFKACCFCGHIFAKDSGFPPITFSTAETEDREGEREVRGRLPSLVSVSLRG